MMQQELREMDAETLEKCHTAILSDKAGEIEFFKSLQYQMGKVQVDISSCFDRITVDLEANFMCSWSFSFSN